MTRWTGSCAGWSLVGIARAGLFLLSLAASGGALAAAPPGAAPGSFTTRLGTFTPQTWAAVNGWSTESHAEALVVFRQTCRSLDRRAGWRQACSAARAAGDGPAASRAFFEAEFVPYLVSATERGKEGLLTGYFEPVLDGSPVRRAPFIVPVFGAPADILYLDARRWQGIDTKGRAVRAVLSGNQVLPAGGAGAPEPAADGLVVDPSVFDSEPLDRRHRVRREGDRILPYWTRQEIEAGKAAALRPIAWVDDAQALYLMQVQGSGRIRMPDGKSVRLSYADQNGHPFRPRGAAPASRTRGLPGGAGAEPVAVATPVSMRTLEIVGAGRQRSRSIAGDDDVNRVVDALLAQPPRSKSERLPPAAGLSGSSGLGAASDARAAMNLGYLMAARENDPSYVFFQPAAAEGSGPVGALGVPLTATRSIAVDPRSTPLGSPVFIEAERDDSAGPLRRLVIAQDTGGAIRGAVRADFFWGTGPRAGAQAVRTRDDLEMWVLLPKDFAPRASGTRTRGIAGAAAAECVMPDAEYCLE